MFDWNDLRYLLAIAREGSTLAAAKSLGVSQPTVQRRLTALEECFDRKLVEHHPTGYRLTELGKALLPHAVDVERSVEAFQRQLMSEGEGLKGTLRVTCQIGGWPRAGPGIDPRDRLKALPRHTCGPEADAPRSRVLRFRGC